MERPLWRRALRALGFVTLGTGVALLSLYWWSPWEFRPNVRELHDGPLSGIDPASIFKKGTRVVVVLAHPDDPEFYAAATMKRLQAAGAQSTLILATDGDKGYYPFGDPVATAAVRRDEQMRAAEAWGCKEIRFYGFPDGRLRASEPLIRRLADDLRSLRPDVVICFDGEKPPRLSHADHRIAGLATQEALKRAGFRGLALYAQSGSPDFLINATEGWVEKLDLLRTHESQWPGGNLGRVEGLLEQRGRNYGKRIGAHYAEGFRAVQW